MHEQEATFQAALVVVAAVFWREDVRPRTTHAPVQQPVALPPTSANDKRLPLHRPPAQGRSTGKGWERVTVT